MKFHSRFYRNPFRLFRREGQSVQAANEEVRLAFEKRLRKSHRRMALNLHSRELNTAWN